MNYIVPLKDQYKGHDGEIVFKFKLGNAVSLDHPKDFTKMPVYILKDLAKLIGLKNYSKMKKKELYDNVSKYISFETSK